jgi:hypothetical protein
MPAHHGKFVSYYRVSTDKQGKSGLGLDAQKAAVADRLNGGRWQIIGEFIEVESGKRASRPQLDTAIAACKKHKAKLVVAKLDRLSRNVSFLLKCRRARHGPHAGGWRGTLTEGGVDRLAGESTWQVSRRGRRSCGIALSLAVEISTPDNADPGTPLRHSVLTGLLFHQQFDMFPDFAATLRAFLTIVHLLFSLR